MDYISEIKAMENISLFDCFQYIGKYNIEMEAIKSKDEIAFYTYDDLVNYIRYRFLSYINDNPFSVSESVVTDNETHYRPEHFETESEMGYIGLYFPRLDQFKDQSQYKKMIDQYDNDLYQETIDREGTIIYNVETIVKMFWNKEYLGNKLEIPITILYHFMEGMVKFFINHERTHAFQNGIEVLDGILSEEDYTSQVHELEANRIGLIKLLESIPKEGLS